MYVQGSHQFHQNWLTFPKILKLISELFLITLNNFYWSGGAKVADNCAINLDNFLTQLAFDRELKLILQIRGLRKGECSKWSLLSNTLSVQMLFNTSILTLKFCGVSDNFT